MNPIATALLIIITLSVLFFVFLAILFHLTFSPMRRLTSNPKNVPKNKQYSIYRDLIFQNIDELQKTDFEGITIKSHDNIKLFGRYYKREITDIIELDFHGYRGNALRDFCGGCNITRNNRISSILVDQRSHSESEGNAITFGIKERYDVVSWVNYTTTRFGKDIKIILCGVSMGAATVLMASELNLPENVIGIIADCPYSSPREIIEKVAKGRGFHPKLLYPFIYLSAKIFANADLHASSPIEAVKNTDIPILIVHGDDDRFVPYYMGKKVYDACASENKRLLTVKGAGHALSYFKDTAAYCSAVNEFVESII